MTFEDLRGFPVLMTKGIAAACEDGKTKEYIIDCLARFYSGDYGLIGAEDAEYNNADLKEGYGHILARYEPKNALESDIYIESHFDADNLNDIDFTQTMIMYSNER